MNYSHNKNRFARQAGAIFVPDGFGFLKRYVRLCVCEEGRNKSTMKVSGFKPRTKVEPGVKLEHIKYLKGLKGQEKVMMLAASSVFSLVKNHFALSVLACLAALYPFAWMVSQIVIRLK